MNYAQLTAAICDYTQNFDQDFVANIPVFVQQAEQRIYSAAQLANLRRNVTSNLIANNKYIAPPANFLSVYSFAVTDLTTGEFTYLLDKDVNFIREAYPNPASVGKPKYYAIFGSQSNDPTSLTLIVGPTPDLAYGVEIHYFYYPESIVTAGTTWLGDHFDTVLLSGSLVEAVTFMKGEADMVALYEKRFAQDLSLLKNLADGKQRGDAFRNGQNRTRAL